ncbi:MAG: hypothetical protein LBF50_07800 [Azoarcus sp.]|jgi:hydroxymethylpyrimidine pyrophosphatase-like HAD family hydrolase|nr:hypothetical protein [Azoarcus sp.]
MLKKFLFADLDDTLFQSRRKCPERGDLTPAAYLRDGSAHSFLTPAQHSLLALFQREMTVIPVTARNADAFSRVRLGFGDGGIINFGGVIIDAHGVPDAPWLARSAALAAGSLAMLEAALAAARTHAASLGVTLRARLIEDFGVPFYLSAKSAEGDEKALDALEPAVRAHCAECAYPVDIHRNGNNLAVLPDWLDKRHAVEHLISQLRARHGEILTLGMGDSLSDLGFMRACDYALIPRASQIAAALEDKT